jgi:competence protein ComEC
LAAFYSWRVAAACLREEIAVLASGGATMVYSNFRGIGNVCLMDTGKSNTVDYLTFPFLKTKGVNSLPALLLTHGDLQHMGGVFALERRLHATRVYSSELRFRSGAYRDAIALFEQSQVLQRLATGGKVAGWTVLHPHVDANYARADDGALCLAGYVGRSRVLYLPDFGRAGQEDLVNRNIDVSAEVVITGLPSEGEPLGDGLLERIRPKLIIVADSSFPARETASSRLRARLGRYGAQVIYTSDCNGIVISSAQGKLFVETTTGMRYCY